MDTQPQIPSSRPICSHPSLSPIKMIQIIVFAAGCGAAVGAGDRVTWAWTLPSRTHWAPRTLRWGSAAGQTSIPTVENGGWLAPLGKDRPPGQLGRGL